MNNEAKIAIASGRKLQALKIEVERLKKAGLIRGPGETMPIKTAKESRGACGPSVEWVAVTPAMAELWLRNNVKNRKLRQTTVDAYARDMRAGNWLQTHQGIAFGENDELLDGQHRLAAIVQAEVTLTLLVTRGLPSKTKGRAVRTQDVMDTGTVRKVGDQLALQHGVKNAAATAGCATVIAMLCRESGVEIKRVTFAQAVGIIEIWGPHIEYVLAHRSQIVGLRSSQVNGAIAFARPVAREATEEFLRRFVTGEDLNANNPILHIRNCLLNQIQRLKMDHGSGKQRALIASRVLQHLYLFFEKRTIQSLSEGKEGPEFFVKAQTAQVEQIRKLFR